MLVRADEAKLKEGMQPMGHMVCVEHDIASGHNVCSRTGPPCTYRTQLQWHAASLLPLS
jgi:hypothetical protein